MVKTACHSTLRNKSGLEGLVSHYAELLADIFHHPHRPSVVSYSFNASAEPRQVHSTDDPDAVDLDGLVGSVLRTVLSSITKVPLELIDGSTSLSAIGVDSITAIQVVSRCKQGGLRLAASDVASSRTVGVLITRLESKGSLPAQEDIPAAADIPEPEKISILQHHFGDYQSKVESIHRMSPGMKWLVGSWQRSEGTRFHHVFAYQVPSQADVLALRSAWRALVSKHAILRATFAAAFGSSEPRLVVHRDDEVHLSDVWSEEVAPGSGDIQSLLESKMLELLSSPPSLKGTLSRAHLLQSDCDMRLVLQLHHVQYDAWSLQLLLRDLKSLYDGTQTSFLNDLPTFLQKMMCTPSELAAQQRYWHTQVPNDNPLLYPPSLLPSCSGLTRNTRVIYTQPHAVSKLSELEALARSKNVSLSAIFLASWSKVQAQFTHNGLVTFGLWSSGRTVSVDDIALLAVPCMNVLPMFVSCEEGKSILEVADAVQNDLVLRVGAVEHSDLEQVHDWLGFKGRPIFNVSVNLVKISADLRPAEDPLFKPVEVRNLQADGPYLTLFRPRTLFHLQIRTTMVINWRPSGSQI